MKRESLTDAAVIGLLGALLAFLTAGPDAAEGLVLGAVAGSVYLTLLHHDVDAVGSPSGATPFDLFNPLRVVRLLVPLALVSVLAMLTALTVGVDAWLGGLRWEPGHNFVGLVASPPLLYGALLGYVLPSLSLQLRGLARAVPEVRDVIAALPGSVGVATRFAQEAEARKAKNASPSTERATQVPVFLVSGPRGCGKTTLVKSLREFDERFAEPDWVATTAGSTSGSGSNHRVISETEFEDLQQSGSLAVSYRPYGEDGTPMDLGLPALAVVAAAVEKGACVLDVDPPTARTLLQYNWASALSTAFPESKMELRFVSVWVTLPSLDAIMERNRQRMQALIETPAAVERQVAPLRSQATADIEWALTSGSFDFTVLNEDLPRATTDVLNAARYCFQDD